ncbi:hypothetical protein H7X87_02755 [Acetobacteraceae bacterium]|nr:hypothetical protein [Candidatus Parcubacteria bacterium]
MNSEENFHKIVLQSILFKGRQDWYFCYLKSEKIAHVLSILLQASDTKDLEGLLHNAVEIPHSILHFAAGEITAESLLADILSLVTDLRLAKTRGFIREENGHVLIHEYEQIGEKIASDNRPSPFISSNDFVLPVIEQKEQENLLSQMPAFVSRSPLKVKDEHKGQIKLKDNKRHEGRQPERMSLILDLVKKNNGISIKDISKNVRDCSEKTIQRELVALIHQGLVRKVGERRWSLYFPTI